MRPESSTTGVPVVGRSDEKYETSEASICGKRTKEAALKDRDAAPLPARL
jgi:hypothetical protein